MEIAHADHVPLRIDEMNTTPCNGVPRAVGHSFASALWALDTLFEMANVGVDGVNIHTYPRAPYNLFSFATEHPRPARRDAWRPDLRLGNPGQGCSPARCMSRR